MNVPTVGGTGGGSAIPPPSDLWDVAALEQAVAAERAAREVVPPIDPVELARQHLLRASPRGRLRHQDLVSYPSGVVVAYRQPRRTAQALQRVSVTAAAPRSRHRAPGLILGLLPLLASLLVAWRALGTEGLLLWVLAVPLGILLTWPAVWLVRNLEDHP